MKQKHKEPTKKVTEPKNKFNTQSSYNDIASILFINLFSLGYNL